MTALTTLRSRLSNEILRDPNNRVRPTSTIDYAISAGYTKVQQDIMGMIPLTDDNETISGVSGTQEYTFATDLKTIKLVRRSGTELTRTTKDQLKSFFSTFTSGIPSHYYIYQNSIGLYPIPNVSGTIDIDYTNILPTLTTSQDTLSPSYLDDAILYRAANVCFRQVARLDMAREYQTEYEGEVNKGMLNLVRDKNLSF